MAVGGWWVKLVYWTDKKKSEDAALIEKGGGLK